MRVRTTVILAAVTLVAAANAEVPLCFYGLKPTYCADVASLDITVKNVSTKSLLLSLSVDKQGPKDSWEEYSADILGTEPFPLKVTAIRLKKQESRALQWRPRQTGNYHEISEGSYRLVANVMMDHAPATKYVVANFSVNKSSCTAKP